MQQQGVKPNVVSWNALIAAFGQCGEGKKAISLFYELLQNLKPNATTFISVPNSCSHSGLVAEAPELFYKMKNEFGITPATVHENSIVDVLGRAGRLDEAESFIQNMAKPDNVTWRTLLGACRTHHSAYGAGTGEESRGLVRAGRRR